MKGYYVYYSYMGWLPSIGDYALFASENDYRDHYISNEEEA